MNIVTYGISFLLILRIAFHSITYGFCTSEDAESLSILSEGYGGIFQGDLAQARDEAIQDAKVKALEKVLGTYVDSQTIIEDEVLLDSTIKDTTRGFIKDYQILEEDRVSDELYRVKIAALVSPGRDEDTTEVSPDNPIIMVSFFESNLGEIGNENIVRDALISQLSEEGYRIVDATRGTHLPSNILIEGEARTAYSQNNGGIISCRACSHLSIIEPSTGKIISHNTVEGIKGFATIKERAGSEALRMLSRVLAKYALEQLALCFNKEERTIEVRVSHISAPIEVNKLYNLFKSTRWVNEVHIKQYSNGRAIFTLRYPEKSLYLAHKLKRYPTLELLSYDWNSIELKLAEDPYAKE